MKVEFIIEGESGPTIVDTLGELAGELADTFQDHVPHYHPHHNHRIIEERHSYDYFGIVSGFFGMVNAISRFFRGN